MDGFKATMLVTVVPYLCAISLKVSPRFTVYTIVFSVEGTSGVSGTSGIGSVEESKIPSVN